MGKIKAHCLVCFLLIAVFTIVISPCLYGQDTLLSKERENEIKTSGNYYWGEGSDFDEEFAKAIASGELSEQISKDAVGQSEQLDEILKAIDIGAHFDLLPQQGKIKILAWIAKEDIWTMVATKQPITQNNNLQSSSSSSFVPQKDEYIPQPEEEHTPLETAPIEEAAPTPEMNPVATSNSVLQKLAACKTYRDFKRVATMNGVVRGEIDKGSRGFLNPENCTIAVFSTDGTLVALLDAGSGSRVDLLSGNTVQNPEQYYNQGDYHLWYMQVKRASNNELHNVENNTNYSNTFVQENVDLSNSSIQEPPPIQNTNRYANASVLLPKDWDGKSILINSFVWIDDYDTALQNKYNIHPNGENFLDDHETWDDDETYYRYPLSPNVLIEAGISDSNTIFTERKMTVNEFANYMRSLGYAVEGNDGYGIAANVTYENKMITKIVEKYIP